MCTAVSWNAGYHYFGRNLDLNYSYCETITITPRNYRFHYRAMPHSDSHYAMIGTAVVMDDYPLYYDATNEKGLSMAGLNFPKSAHYNPPKGNADNITPFELIPWILSQCTCVAECRILLQRINIANIPFSEQLPLTPLHWIIADQKEAITLEATANGLNIHRNNIGILTNEPPFQYHLYHLNSFIQTSPKPAQNLFAENFELAPISAGAGSMGLPGDYSSPSRFVRAAFVKMNSVSNGSEAGDVHQFFHILDSVAMPHGCVELETHEFEITRYSSCCNTDLGIYYYATYGNRQITAVEMHNEDLDALQLISYPMITTAAILHQNGVKG